MSRLTLALVLVLFVASLAACMPTAAPTATMPAANPTVTASVPPAPTLTATRHATSGTPTATRVPPTSTRAPASATLPATVQATVYFTDRNRFAAGTPPFEVAVQRTVPASASLPQAVLAEFFKGPTAAERQRGLEAITSGFTGFSALQIQNGIARVYLAGRCASHGATYTVAQPIMKNLLQFPEIKAVKIYDADGTTEQPDGIVNSIPVCLEP